MSMCVPSVYPSHGSSRTSLFFQALHSPEVAALAVTTRLSRGMPRGHRHAVARRVRLVGGKATRSNVVLTAPVAPRVRADVDALMSGLYALGILWQRACT